MDNATKEYARKLLDEMNLIDDFLFNEIMADERKGEEVCRMILSRVLKREITKITFVPQKEFPGIAESAHGIRLDAFIKEQTGSNEYDFSVYDIEPDQRKDKKLMMPKRSRYYTDLMDVHLLETGADYDKLPEAAGDDEKKLKDLLTYIQNSTETNVTDDMTRRLDEIVKETKADKYVGVRFMKSWELLREAKKEGMEEGKEEERVNTERERQRADAEKARADAAEARVKELEEKLAGLVNP